MIRERDIERKVCDLAKAAGWLAYKFTSPAQRGIPDRIFIRQGRIVFIEFKAPGAMPTKLQWRMIERLRGHGCEVHVCDSIESGCNALSL